MDYFEMVSKTGKKRSASYRMMVDHLKSKVNPLVVETGCMREEDNFAGDGMSTLIFDDVITTHGGEFLSVDIDPVAVDFAQSRIKTGKVTCSDSVKYLYELNKQLRKENRYIDLLYLDSYDLDLENPADSCFHHMKELLAIMPSLKEDSMIAVDDNDLINAIFPGETEPQKVVMGKGIYIYKFFENVGVEIINKGYQMIWKL